MNPAFRITAKWLPYTTPHQIHMGTVLGTTLDLPSPGYVEFVVDGQTVRLDAMGGENGIALSFRDGTYKTTTYGAGRELSADMPSDGLKAPGTIVVDFNKAGNWPCAYTQYGTCPLPPQQNRFNALIPTGEKRYHETGRKRGYWSMPQPPHTLDDNRCCFCVFPDEVTVRNTPAWPLSRRLSSGVRATIDPTAD